MSAAVPGVLRTVRVEEGGCQECVVSGDGGCGVAGTMRLPKIFEGGSLTLRRTSSVSAPVEPEDKPACGAPREHDGRSHGVDSVNKSEGRWMAAGGVVGGAGTGKNRNTPTNNRPESKISLLWKLYGPGSSEALPMASAAGGKADVEADNSKSGKKELKYFRGFGRKFSMRSSGETKKGPPVRRSNTITGTPASCNGIDSSLQQKFSVLLAGEQDSDLPLEASEGDRKDIESCTMVVPGARAAARGRIWTEVAAQHHDQGPSCRVITSSPEVIHPGRNLAKETHECVTSAASEPCSEAEVSHCTSRQERSDTDLSRGSSVCTLRQEGSHLTSHYLSASEVAVSEVTSCDLPLIDLTSSEATPTISPYSSIRSSVTRGLPHAQPGAATLPTTPTNPRSYTQAPARNLNVLSHFLASFRDATSPAPQETYDNLTCDTTGQSPSLASFTDPPWERSEYSRSSSVTSSGTASDGGQGSSEGMCREVGSQGHRCPRCQVIFLTSRQLLEHWSVFHTHDALQLNLSPLYRLNPYRDVEDGDVQRKGPTREKQVEEEAGWGHKRLHLSTLDPPSSQVRRRIFVNTIYNLTPKIVIQNVVSREDHNGTKSYVTLLSHPRNFILY